MTDLPDAVVEAAAREQEKHVGLISTQSMQTDGDDGGLKCSCEQWSAGPDENGWRPWRAWHEHVARAALAAASGPWAEQLDAARTNTDEALAEAARAGCGELVERLRADLAAALARNAELEANWQRSHEAVHAWEKSDAALRAELDNLRGKCICNTGPGTDGPEETCPVHGRSYTEWVERGDILQARLDNLRDRVNALADEWEPKFPVAGTLIGGELPAYERLRAIVRGSDDE